MKHVNCGPWSFIDSLAVFHHDARKKQGALQRLNYGMAKGT